MHPFPILILDQPTVVGRDDVEWEEVVDTAYMVVEKELGATPFDMTLARALDVLGIYKVLRIK